LLVSNKETSFVLAHLSARHLSAQMEEIMAQTHSDHRRGGGGSFYLPQRLIVQLAYTEESPEGGVVHMEPGWYTPDNTDPRVLDHPIVRRLLPQDGNAASRNNAQAEMNRKIAQGEAVPSDMQKLLQEQAADEAKERESATEAWNQKAQEAADKGAVYGEPHPDPAVVIARSLTSPVPLYVGTYMMQSKIMDQASAVTPPPPVRPTVAPAGQRGHAPEPAKD
jgi:hypothetical protein